MTVIFTLRTALRAARAQISRGRSPWAIMRISDKTFKTLEHCGIEVRNTPDIGLAQWRRVGSRSRHDL